MSSFFLVLFDFFRKNRLLALAILLVFTGLSVFFALKLKMKEDVSAMMPKDKRIEKMNLVFQNSRFSDKLILNVFFKDSNNTDPALLAEFTDTLAARLRTRFQPALIASVKDKVSDENINEVFNTVYQNLPVYLSQQDYDRLDTLLLDANLESQIQRNYKMMISPASMVLKKFVVADPLGMGGNVMKKLQNLQHEENFELYESHIISKDQKNVLAFINPVYGPSETGKNAPLIHGIEEEIVKVEKEFSNKVTAECFGAAAVSVGNAERIKSDITITVSLAITVLVVFLGLFFRQAPVVLIIFLPVAIGGLISLAALYFIKGEISAIALGMGSVLLGITVDYSLHIFTHFRSTGSINAVFKDLPLPLFLSCFITASSFLCLLFVKSPALQDLGLFAAISVVNALLVALTVLPHFLKKKLTNSANQKKGLSIIDKYTSYRFDKSPVMIGLVILLTVLSLFGLPKVAFETDMMKMNYISEKLSKAEQHLFKITSLGLKSIYIVSSGENLEVALKNNESVNQRIQTLIQKGDVKSSSGVGDFILSESLQKQRINKWNTFWAPGKKEEVKRKLRTIGAKYKFNEQAFSQFFTLLDTKFEPVSAADSKHLRELLFDDYISDKKGFSTVVTLLKVNESDKEKVYSAFPEEEHVTMIDRKYITSKFVTLMKEDFNTLEVLSLGLVFIVLIISYGRIELGVIAFVPMAVSWLWTLGIMGLLGIKFNIINIIISTFILGLGIDYSIFIMTGLIEEYKTGKDHINTFKTSIFLSAFTSITGIGALIFAEHPALKSIAVLSIVGMLSVITISYTLQPLLFRLLITSRTKRGLYPYTASSIIVTLFAYIYFLFGCLILSLLALVLLPILPVRYKLKKKIFHAILTKFSWSIIYIMVNVKKVVINTDNEDFSKPAIIVANHQSFLDILCSIMLSPKIVLVTNDWVWNSPFFGRVVRYADFFPASKGMEEGLPELEQRIKEGFSILIFPEGTRSVDGQIARFHKGAFFLAEKLNLDIIPMVFHGTGNTITKGDFLLKNSQVTIKIFPRIKSEDRSFGSTYQERTKEIVKFFRAEYSKLKTEIETPAYNRDNLIKNFIYKGPVLEWYTRIKTRLENNYSLYHQLLPSHGKIVDIGCGYGYMAYMLSYLSEDRNILGIDYDEEKIEVANNCFSKSSNMQFISADITAFELPVADAFVMADILHYLPAENQEKVIEKCIQSLNDGGVILIREGNTELQEKHKRTVLTETFSTRIVKFNKTTSELSFLSSSQIENICRKNNVDFSIVDKTKVNSNTLFVIRMRKNETMRA